MKVCAVLAALLALAACGPAGSDPGPGAVTVDEARALDAAAEMVETRQLPPAALGSAPASDRPEAEARR